MPKVVNINLIIFKINRNICMYKLYHYKSDLAALANGRYISF